MSCIIWRDTLAEDVVRPDLVAKDHGDENDRRNRHNGERVLRRGRIVDRETPSGVET